MIAKGKRTKRRQRPHSPIRSSTVNPSSAAPPAVEPSNYSPNINKGGRGCDHIYSNLQDPTTITLHHHRCGRPSSSSEEDEHNLMYRDSATREELHEDENDQDMANCLILLAQGQSRGGGEGDQDTSSSQRRPFKTSRFIITLETRPTSYLFECRTCGKTFPSFQALGGHCASHNKPKRDQKEKHHSPLHHQSDLEVSHPPHHRRRHRNYLGPSDPSLQLGGNCNRRGFDDNKNDIAISSNIPHCHGSDIIIVDEKPRVHGCSICRAEFSSGQALGGHMRRHRGGDPRVGARGGVLWKPHCCHRTGGCRPPPPPRSSLSSSTTEMS